MKYIVCKTFNGKALDGIISLTKGSTLTEKNGFLYHNNSKICYKTSQNARDYFAPNDDKKGQERFNLIQEILGKLQEYASAYYEAVENVKKTFTEETTEEEASELLGAIVNQNELAYQKIKELHPDFVNDYNTLQQPFYEAEVEDLERLVDLL